MAAVMFVGVFLFGWAPQSRLEHEVGMLAQPVARASI